MELDPQQSSIKGSFQPGDYDGVANAGHPPTGSLGFTLRRVVLRSLPARNDKHFPLIFVDVFGFVAIYHTPGKI